MKDFTVGHFNSIRRQSRAGASVALPSRVATNIVLGSLFIACASVSAHAIAADTPSSPSPTPVQVVDALNGVFGKQVHGRAIHAKGIVLEGSFMPLPSAGKLSRAAHLTGGAVPITVRFSDFAGIPTISDTDGLASPRGMAIKFHMAHGADTDIVAHSVNGFPSATTADFHDLMVALGSSPPGMASPTPAETYLGTHPAAKAFFANLTPPPASFATVAYYGVNSFEFSNHAGQKQLGRYQIIPEAGVHLLPSGEVASSSPDYLNKEINERLRSGPAKFVLQVQIAQPTDATEDPSVAWPASRSVVKLGVITVKNVRPDSDMAQESLMFTPSAVADGIRPADPMVADRNAAYGVSYGRRHAAGERTVTGSLTGTAIDAR